MRPVTVLPFLPPGFAQRTAYAVPRYAPPQPAPAVVHDLGQGLAAQLPAASRVKSVAAPAIGGGVLLLGGMILPGTIGTISTFAGIGLIGYAGYELIAGGAPPAPAVPVSPPKAPPGVMAQQLALTLDPLQPDTGSTTRNMWTNQDYEFIVRNNTNQPLAFFAGLAIYDSDQKLVFKSAPEAIATGRKAITVDPGTAIKATLTAPSISFFLPQTVTVEVQLFRNRTDTQEFMRSEAIPIKMAYIG